MAVNAENCNVGRLPSPAENAVLSETRGDSILEFVADGNTGFEKMAIGDLG